MSNKHKDVSEVANGADKTVGEVGEGKGIEKVAENDIVEAAKMEGFMNQELTIVVAKDGTPGAYDVITPNVNGVNQPIILGIKQKVKRKYVEALARSRITAYDQETPDPRRPENFVMKDITVLTHPFSVLADPHPDGAVWLQEITNQP